MIDLTAHSLDARAGRATRPPRQPEQLEEDMEIELKILDPRIELPQYATPGAAAIDLRACSVHETDCPASLPQNPLAAAYTAYPGERLLIGTGIALHMDGILREMDGDMRDFATVGALILPRSGLGKLGITLGNAPGLVDADYTGEIKLALWNASGATFSFSPLPRSGRAGRRLGHRRAPA
jgi:dUTP pyrophosphatase